MKTFSVILLALMVVGCSEHNIGDKVCCHRLGVCQGEVMEIYNAASNREQYVIFFEKRSQWPSESYEVPTTEGNIRRAVLYANELRRCEDEYFPNYPLHER